MKFSNLMRSAAVGAMLAFGAADALELEAFYRRGNMTCNYFEKREKDANKTIYADNVNVQLIYAFCLVVKGESTGNQSEVNKGLSMLYHFADDKDHVFANFFLAKYHFSGGAFSNKISKDGLEEATYYYLRTLAIIKTWNNYPPLKYVVWEEDMNIELESYAGAAQVYIQMFTLAFNGDLNLRLLKSRNYKGDRDINTYPEHNKNGIYYLDRAIEHAGYCKVLRKKPHFKQELYTPFIKLCELLQEEAVAYKELELKRYEMMNQAHCRDLHGASNNTNCPEMNELVQEFLNTLEEVERRGNDIWAAN